MENPHGKAMKTPCFPLKMSYKLVISGDFQHVFVQVCDANIQRLREAIDRGPEKHPGACFWASMPMVKDELGLGLGFNHERS